MKTYGPPSPHLRSPDFSAIRGARLTDARIAHYIRAGFYGEEKRRALLDAKRPARPRLTKPTDLAAALSILSAL